MSRITAARPTDQGDPRRYVDLLEGIELATKALSGAPGPDTAYWRRYRARLYRRLHAECPRSALAGYALSIAETDEKLAALRDAACGTDAETAIREAPAVWSDAVAPGGYVCAVETPGGPDGICGYPIESEPCPRHFPGPHADDWPDPVALDGDGRG